MASDVNLTSLKLRAQSKLHDAYVEWDSLPEDTRVDEASLLREEFLAFDRKYKLTPQLMVDYKLLIEFLERNNLFDTHAGLLNMGPQTQLVYHFLLRYRDAFIYVHGIGWMYWTGTHWAIDKGNARVGDAVHTIGEQIAIEAVTSGTYDFKKPVINMASTASGIDGVLEIARKKPAFRVDIEELDADPFLLNTPSGTLDLHDFTLAKHKPSDRITKVTRASYDPTAQSKLWEETFLARILPNPEVRAFLQRYVGVALLGNTPENVLAIGIGTLGRNGKSKFYSAISYMLGDYAISTDSDLLLHRDGAHPTGLMDLMGVRWAVASETEGNKTMASATVKRLTGGDVIRARRMHKDFVQFVPSHTLFLVSNDMPAVKGHDPALWSRLKIIPFHVRIPDSEQIKDLEEQLELQADAILAWAVRGLIDYRARGNSLDDPEEVRIATTEQRDISDEFGAFLSEVCELKTNYEEESSSLFEAYSDWAKINNAVLMNTTVFGRELTHRGFPSRKTNGKVLRQGIRLRKTKEELFIEETES